jgi:hypothetical protein
MHANISAEFRISVFWIKLKAGIIKSTIDSDLLNCSYQALAKYYWFIISLSLPRSPSIGE